MTDLVSVEPGRVAVLALDNPPLNILTGKLLEQLDEALGRLENVDEGEVRAVVVTGRGGRAFSVGSNVREFESHRGPGGRERFELEARIAQRLAGLPMPTIAAIDGACLGGGLELAMCCDLRIATGSSQLGMPEVRLAVTPSTGGTQRLPRIVGIARAKELLLTGRVISATEAERIGLVNEVVAGGTAVDRAREIGDEIAQRGPLAVREVKLLADAALERDLAAGHQAETEASVRIFATEDMLEGARSFLDKRPPVYKGR